MKDAERSQEISRLYRAALACDPQTRDAFLRAACAADDVLRQEVEFLLKQSTAELPTLSTAVTVGSGDQVGATAATHGIHVTDPKGSQAPGRKFGPYEIVSSLGAGGMGEVYRARDHRLERDVALKFLPRGAAHDDVAIARFSREARAASSLNHPNIVTIHEIGETETDRYVVMEVVEGRTIRDVVREAPPPDSVIRIALQVAQALAVAHAAGIVHRDIKPENVMVRADGYVKLLDFGLVSFIPASGAVDDRRRHVPATPGVLLGTVRYMSPEQASGQAIGSATDVFSLGVVVYELASGRHPFVTDSTIGVLSAIVSQPAMPPSRLNPEISPELDALVLQMLEKDPRLRPSAAQVAGALLELLETRPRTTGGGVKRLRGSPALQIIGRERERTALATAFDRVARGKSLLMCVSGEPGVGKTALLESFAADVSTAGSFVGRGRCSERLSGTNAYLPLLEVLDSLIQARSGDQTARIMELLAPNWYSQLAPVAGSATTGRSLPQGPVISPERLKQELGQFFEEVSRERPLVLVLEDVHWLDLSSTDILASLLERFTLMRALVVVSFRPTDMLAERHPFVSVKRDAEARGHCEELRLDGLGRHDVEQYLAAMFPLHEFPAEFLDLIYGKTEGNPLFFSSLLRELRARHNIVETQGCWKLAESVAEISRALPESLSSMIERQIDRIEDGERRLLLGACVQGTEFHASVVSRALALDAADVEEALESLARIHGLVRRLDEEELPNRTLTVRYRFAHVLYHDALYLSLTPARRAALSVSVAQAILASYGDQAPASQLALLFEAARDFSSAADYFMRAATGATRVAAYREAVLLARRGLNAVGTLPETAQRDDRELTLLVTLGVPLTASQSYAAAEAGEVYGRARELAQRSASPRVFPVLHGLHRFYFVRAELDTSMALARELLDRAERAGDSGLLVMAHNSAAYSQFFHGDCSGGRLHGETAVSLFDSTEHASFSVVYGADPIVAGQSVIALALWNEGRVDEARRCVREAIVRARDVKHPPSLAWALSYAALVYYNSRDHAACRAAAEECVQIAEEFGLAFWRIGSSIMRAAAAFAEGAPAETSLGDIRNGIATWFRVGAQLFAPYYLTLMAEALLSTGQLLDAQEVIAQAVQLSDRYEERWWQAEHYRVCGEVALHNAGAGENGPEAAEVWLLKALESARHHGATSHELRAAMTFARLRAAQGRAEEGRQLLHEVCGRFGEEPGNVDLQAAARLLETGQ